MYYQLLIIYSITFNISVKHTRGEAHGIKAGAAGIKFGCAWLGYGGIAWRILSHSCGEYLAADYTTELLAKE